MTKNKKFLLTIGILMVVFGFYFFVFLPKNFKEYKQLSSKRKEMVLKLSQVDEELARQKRLEQKRHFLGKQVSEIKHRFFSDKDPSVFLEYISRVANEAQADIVQISPLEERALEGEGLVEVPISINAKGSYHQIGYFLNQLECGDKHVAISEVDITASGRDTFSHNANIMVSIYVFQEI